MNYILFGGSGFIGTHLIHLLLKECVRPGDVIYDLDLVMPGEEGVVPGIVEKNDGVQYIRLDVRKPIDFEFVPTPEDVIFDLAAVHRTPGHPEEAYFETNIRGAENVTAFAEKYGIRKILFTSSIAPYGASEDLKTEETLPTPNTPYGISMPRLYRGQKKGYFFYAGRKDTIKACIYVKELVRFFKYRMLDHSFPGAEIYNCTYEPAYTIEEICDAMQKATGLHRHVPLVPAGLLLFAAGILGPIGGKKVGIHPARVRKLMVSTNVCGRKLAATDYKFHYTLEESFRDWFEDCDRKELV